MWLRGGEDSAIIDEFMECCMSMYVESIAVYYIN